MSQPVSTDEKKIDELLHRSVREILPSREEFRAALLSGRRLRFYIGTDATGTSLHLGHATNYMILERFRQLGHEIIFLVGDFTARIGDPTDKNAVRTQLTREQVVEHVQTWLRQVAPIIKINDEQNPVTVKYNNDWLAPLTLEDVVDLASNFTVQHMLERDMFERRLTENKPIYLHEFLYPLMQGYDSVAMDVDVEMCGSDQKFNALAGRTLLKRLKNKEKFVYITTLLENPKTGEKMMSKSQGTGVFLDANPTDMYGGIMAQPDENVRQLFVDTTWVPLREIEQILTLHPKEAKMRLAREVVSLYHGTEIAKQVEDGWSSAFSEGGAPSDVPEITVAKGAPLREAVGDAVESTSELRRLVDAGAVREVGGEAFTSIDEPVDRSMTLRIGKHRFLKITVE